MISPDAFLALAERMEPEHGDVEWSEAIKPPTDPNEFAAELIFVICNSGMKNTVARGIYERVMRQLHGGCAASAAFGHKGKVAAIEDIWGRRRALFAEFVAAQDKLAWLGALPWIGPITKFHAAKNFGVDCCKPDVHLARLAIAWGTTPDALCRSLAAATGYRVATIDTVLWRACATGAIDSRTGQMAA